MSICHSLTEIIGIRTGSCRWDLMIYFKWANVHHLYIHIKAIFLYLGLLAPFTFFLCRTGDVSNLLLSPQPPSLRKELMRYDFCENVTVKAWVKLALGKCGYASTHSLSGEIVLVGGGWLKINCTGTGAVLQVPVFIRSILLIPPWWWSPWCEPDLVYHSHYFFTTVRGQACERVTVHHLFHCLKSFVVVMTESKIEMPCKTAIWVV